MQKNQNGRKHRLYLKAAKRYVDEQLQTMKKHGVAPKLSAKEYKSLVKRVAHATVK